MQPVDFANLNNQKESIIARRPAYSPCQLLFLRRLEQLFTKRRQYAGRLQTSDWRLKLIDRSLYSTYCDCVQLGLLEEAKTLLERAR